MQSSLTFQFIIDISLTFHVGSRRNVIYHASSSLSYILNQYIQLIKSISTFSKNDSLCDSNYDQYVYNNLNVLNIKARS